jgi:predicted AAA+ superfamily ATPase
MTATFAIIFTVNMMAMYTRGLGLPERSFFLFGPRGTGKTTWLRQQLGGARWYDLLREKEQLRLLRDGEVFQQEVEALKPGSWVVIDEVQRMPSLLDEVQDIISRRGKAVRFALTGSSARKLKRGQANLLAARVVNRRFFPLTAAEMGRDFRVGDVLKFGTLPAVASEDDEHAKIDLLETYVENYIGQEIRAEAAVKRLDSFARFLVTAGLANAQVTSVAGIARDAAVARPTVNGYFDILVDTLIGTWLPAWRPRAKVKEIAHPKFYFFDAGVARAVANRLREPLDGAEQGHLFETYVLHELRAWMNQASTGGELAYWRTPSGSEVDFVWTRAGRSVGIEVKSTPRWKAEYSRPLGDLLGEGSIGKAFGVYLGQHELEDRGVRVLPLAAFLAALAGGDVIG